MPKYPQKILLLQTLDLSLFALDLLRLRTSRRKVDTLGEMMGISDRIRIEMMTMKFNIDHNPNLEIDRAPARNTVRTSSIWVIEKINLLRALPIGIIKIRTKMWRWTSILEKR
jgi:hypothetical protein